MLASEINKNSDMYACPYYYVVEMSGKGVFTHLS